MFLSASECVASAPSYTGAYRLSAYGVRMETSQLKGHPISGSSLLPRVYGTLNTKP